MPYDSHLQSKKYFDNTASVYHQRSDGLVYDFSSLIFQRRNKIVKMFLPLAGKKEVILDIEGDLLKISYKKTQDDEFHSGTIYNGLSKKSFNLGYKIAPKFDLSVTEAEMANGLLKIFIPLAEDAKPKSVKIK